MGMAVRKNDDLTGGKRQVRGALGARQRPPLGEQMIGHKVLSSRSQQRRDLLGGRPAPPPAFDSATAKAALVELKEFECSPASNHRAVYWEVFGGGRGFALWNEVARLKLLEYGTSFNAPASARVLAALNVAYQDATIACFDAKYAYWYLRPS
jgi:hypothetical protein